MEFKVQSSELVSMLKVIIKGFDPRDDASFIYFKIEDNKLVAISDSQSAYFSGSIPITGYKYEDGDDNIFYVEGETLRRLSGIFPDAPVAITFSVNQKSRLFVIKYTGHSFRLPIISDNTEMPVPVTTKIGMIQAPDFFAVLNSLVKIVDTDPASQEFASSCLHLKFAGNKVSAMGTDRYAIAEITKEFTAEDENADEQTIMIRQPQAALLSKTVSPAEVLTLVQTNSSFGYIDGQGILSLVSETSMAPLAYSQMKEIASDDCSITVDYTDFKTTIDTIGKLLSATNTIILKIDEDGNAKVESISGDVMDLATISVKGIDSPQQYMFARNVLSEALIPVDTHSIRIQWAEPQEDQQGGIFQIVPVDDDDEDEENIFIGVIPNA